MGVFCVILAAVVFGLSLTSLIWSGFIIIEENDTEARGYALFNVLKTCIVVPAIIALLFVFSAHLSCDNPNDTWNVKPHCDLCSQCNPKALQPEREPK